MSENPKEISIECEWKGYGQSCEISKSNLLCDKCKIIKEVLLIDTSGGEYSTLKICKECISALFNEISLSDYPNR